MTKTALKTALRNAECQCLIWELSSDANAKVELAKWEAEYSSIEAMLAA